MSGIMDAYSIKYILESYSVQLHQVFIKYLQSGSSQFILSKTNLNDITYSSPSFYVTKE